MNEPAADLSVIIVNWNSAEYIRKCLSGIYRETAGVAFEVIVLDNASFDGCDRILREEFPGITFIQLQENLGFARANNIGASEAKGRLLCLLNPDTELCGNVFREVRDAMNAAGPGVGAAGCRLLNADRSLQTSCLLPFPTIVNQALDIEWLKMKTWKWKLWGIGALYDKISAAPIDVEAISGACMFVRREVFGTVGGFGEEYFMYAEDMDLCYKIRKAGFRVVYCPFAQIVHYGGGSTRNKTPGLFSTVMMRETIFQFLKKHRSPVYARLYRCSQFIVALIRIVIIIIAMPVAAMAGKGKRLPPVLKKWGWVAGWAMGGTSGIIGNSREKK